MLPRSHLATFRDGFGFFLFFRSPLWLSAFVFPFSPTAAELTPFIWEKFNFPPRFGQNVAQKVLAATFPSVFFSPNNNIFHFGENPVPGNPSSGEKVFFFFCRNTQILSNLWVLAWKSFPLPRKKFHATPESPAVRVRPEKKKAFCKKTPEFGGISFARNSFLSFPEIPKSQRICILGRNSPQGKRLPKPPQN